MQLNLTREVYKVKSISFNLILSLF